MTPGAAWLPEAPRGRARARARPRARTRRATATASESAAACTRCGGFFVCRKAAGEKGLGPEHCTNPRCERSLEFARLSPEDKKAFMAVNLAIREAEAAAARLAATRAEADAVNAGIFPQLSTAAAAAAPGAAAPVVIDVDAQYSPLTPPGAAAAAGHSDTDVSSPVGEPVGQAAWAFGTAARTPPTKDPSPAQMAAMTAHPPKGHPAAGAAVEPVNLLTQSSMGAGASPSPTASQASGPGAAHAAGAADPASSLAALWPDGPAATHAEMMQWAAAELTSRRAAALQDTESLRQAREALAAAEDRVRQLEQQAVLPRIRAPSSAGSSRRGSPS